jgi:mRNA-degrading endonuclease toxin of MazEF toxin-antitoxin module
VAAVAAVAAVVAVVAAITQVAFALVVASKAAGIRPASVVASRAATTMVTLESRAEDARTRATLGAKE